MPKSLYKEE